MAGESHIFEHALHHTQDANHIEVSPTIARWLGVDHVIELPSIGPLQITKYMLLELIVALLLIAVFIPMARSARRNPEPRGRVRNLLESMVAFIRDGVARNAIGEHGADRFVPFLATLFFFVLFCNLFGLIPWAGSPTANIAVTGMLAVCSFSMTLVAGMQQTGVVGFFKALVPHVELHWAIAIPLLPLLFGIELIGLFIRHGVLAIRLFANIFGGHMVLSVLLLLIGVAPAALVALVAPASVFGVVALSLLELFIAFLQAYIITFLSALFIGMALHPH